MANVDHYAVLGITSEATPAEIKKAHKVLALRYHPDKNEGDEAAAKKFMEIQESYNVLTDEKLKQAFDELVKVKQEKEARKNDMNKKRKADIDALEERERAAKRKTEGEAQANYLKELKRMREETARKMAQMQAQKAADNERKAQSLVDQFESKQSTLEAEAAKAEEITRTVQLRWKKKNTVDQTMIEVIFRTFGEIDKCVAGKKQGIVVFKDNAAAANAVHSLKQGEVAMANEVGLTAEWVKTEPSAEANRGVTEADHQSQGPPSVTPVQDGEGMKAEAGGPRGTSPSTSETPPVHAASNMPAFSSFDSSNGAQDGGILSHRDYESLTMSRMRQAAERQRLIAEIEAQEAGEADSK